MKRYVIVVLIMLVVGVAYAQRGAAPAQQSGAAPAQGQGGGGGRGRGNPEQQAAAIASKEELEKSGRFNRPIVTQIEPASTFWRAEEYHQHYLQKRGQAHCAV